MILDTSSPQAYSASGGTLTNGQIPTQTAPTGTTIDSPNLVPATPSAIAVDSLSNPPITPPTLPTPATAPNYSSVISSALPPPVTTTDPTTRTDNTATTASQKLLTNIKSLMGLDTGKATFTQEQLDASGATALTARQNILQGKIQALNDKAQGIPTQEQKNAEGRGVTVAGLAPITNADLRNNALEALSLKAEYDLNSGDLQNAKDTAQKAVDLKYADTENQITQQTNLLKIYEPFMTAEQKAKSDTLTATNTAKATALADQKKQQQDVINTAQTNGDTASASAALRLDPNSSTFKEDLAKIQASIKIKTTSTTDKWSDPYSLGGDLVQKNLTTGEVRTAVNVGSAPKPQATTVSERQAQSISNFSNTFVPGATLPNGVPVLDNEGYITPEAWQAAIKDAPAEGLTRSEFIKQFGHLIYAGGQVSSKYKLTAPELKLITG